MHEKLLKLDKSYLFWYTNIEKHGILTLKKLKCFIFWVHIKGALLGRRQSEHRKRNRMPRF